MSNKIQRTKNGAKKVERHTVDIHYDRNQPTLYGGPNIECCPPLFDLKCTDGSVGIFHTGGEWEMAMRWLGLKRATSVYQRQNYLQYMGGIRRTAGDTTMPGTPESICEPGDGVSFGKPCIDEQSCFSLLKIIGDPVVNGGNSLPYCENDPRVFIDGVQITDEEAWHEANVTETIWNTFVYNVMWGYRNAQNPLGHYGLWSLLGGFGDATKDYQYPCPELAPKILDWGGNPACSATPMPSITLGGQALSDTYRTNLFLTLRSIIRALKRQIGKTKGLGGGPLQYGDMCIMIPEQAIECIIQCAVCYTECGVGNQPDYSVLNTERASAIIQELRNGGEGYGELVFDGFRIPFIPFDPTLISYDGTTTTELGGMVNPDGTFNALVLFRGVGNNKTLSVQYNPLDDGTWETRDNGLIQIYKDTAHDLCERMGARMEFRIDRRGMMFNLLIKNISCEQILPSQLINTFDTQNTGTCP